MSRSLMLRKASKLERITQVYEEISLDFSFYILLVVIGFGYNVIDVFFG